MIRKAIGAAAFAAVLAGTTGAARCDAPQRVLVYTFEYAAQKAAALRASDDPVGPQGAVDQASEEVSSASGSGFNHFGGPPAVKGTLTVNVERQQNDGGLVLTIEEHSATNTRNVAAATCVVFANTRVICDPNVTLTTEEYTLLRFLGAGFVDPGRLDAKKHWAVGLQLGADSVAADYTVKQSDGPVLTIGEVRTYTSPGTPVASSYGRAKIVYDFAKSVPTAIDEFVTQGAEAAASGNAATVLKTTLKLQSDSNAKP